MSDLADKVLVVAAAPGVSADLIAALALSTPVVVAVDGGASACLSAGVRPSLYVGDADSLPADDLEALTSAGVEVVLHPAEKDQTDLELALDMLAQRGVREVVVTRVLGGRLDHELAALGAVSARPGLLTTIAEPSMTAWVLSADGRRELELCGEGALVSLVPTVPARVTVTGVRWELDRDALEPLQGRGVSNVITSERCRVTIHQGTVLVISHMMDGVIATPV